jgi:hypothetical protein
MLLLKEHLKQTNTTTYIPVFFKDSQYRIILDFVVIVVVLFFLGRETESLYVGQSACRLLILPISTSWVLRL